MLPLLVITCSVIWTTCRSLPVREHSLQKFNIVNGKRAAHIIPFVVSVELDDNHFCGGTIISENIILTAGHCAAEQNVSHLAVRAGTKKRQFGGQLVRVADYKIHPNFTWSGDYDVAVLLLEKSLQFGKRVTSIPIAIAANHPKPGLRAMISGWGVKSEDSGYLADDLLFGFIKIVKSKNCKKYYDDFKDGMLCAGHPKGKIDACNRDSGGPLVAKGRLIGVISAGLGCARDNIPAVYMDVAYFRPWIDNVVKYFNNNENKVQTAGGLITQNV